MIRFACPGCNSTFSVPDEQAGQPGACDKCGVRFLIPAPLTAPIEVPPSRPSELEPRPLATSAKSNAPEIRNCPTCEAKISVLPEDIGHDVECPACKAIFTVKDNNKPKASSRRRHDDDDDDREEPRPRRSSRRSRRDEEDDEDENPDSKYRRRSSRKYAEDEDYERDERGYIAKPSEVQTIGVLLIVGGVLACLYFLAMAGFTGGRCCFWPGTYYELVYGIMAIIRGSQLTQDRAFAYPPNAVCIMGIVTIINGDVLNLTLGIVGLCLLNSDNVRRYFRS